MSTLSGREIWELLKSTFIVGLVFTIANRPEGVIEIAVVFSVSIVCAGAGFFLHELMHKVAAERLGYLAEYHASQSAFISIVFAFAGWILLAPGAVYISSITKPITKAANGFISLAGPATNMALAAMFYILSSGSPIML